MTRFSHRLEILESFLDKDILSSLSSCEASKSAAVDLHTAYSHALGSALASLGRTKYLQSLSYKDKECFIDFYRSRHSGKAYLNK